MQERARRGTSCCCFNLGAGQRRVAGRPASKCSLPRMSTDVLDALARM